MCTATDCTRPGRNKNGAGLCEAHYYRQRRGSTLTAPVSTHYPAGTPCSVDGCAKPRVAQQLCDMHYARLVRHGDVTTVIAVEDRQFNNPRAEVVSYGAMHQRLTKDRGPASAHPCFDCGSPARQWSYDHSDPDQLYGPWPYSLDPNRYVPRCVSCHKRMDLMR
ncbi:HNH endonuclease [Gordonia phage Soos]|nr:HNH endonuclease [Gordonia phage Soos]